MVLVSTSVVKYFNRLDLKAKIEQWVRNLPEKEVFWRY